MGLFYGPPDSPGFRSWIGACRVAAVDHGMKNIVYFDLETQKSAEDDGGWGNIRDMRMSVGVTYSTARGDYRIYGEPQVNDLIEELAQRLDEAAHRSRDPDLRRTRASSGHRRR